jgi:hypothetical protein
MSTPKLLLCLVTVFLFEAAAPVSAAVPSTGRSVTGVTITDANDATTTSLMRPKKKAKKARKRGGKKGCEAYNS